jgi:glucokinase
MTHWVAGIDLGASKIAMGLVSPANEIAAARRFPTEARRGPDYALERIAAALDEMAHEAGAQPAAIGVCSPGPVNVVDGVILDPPNLGWRNVPFRHMLRERFGLPVTLEHDAKAAALGEFHFGWGREFSARDLVYVIVGTGIGAAIILDGHLYRGRTNASGEIGHITIDRHGPPGSSGVIGAVEVYAGGPAIARAYVHRGGAENAEGIGAGEVAKRALEGDINALAVFEDAGDALGAAIATTAMLMDVDLFVIGGSVARAGDLLLEPARRAVPKYSHSSVAPRVRIMATRLHEDGPILGCAWQARQIL